MYYILVHTKILLVLFFIAAVYLIWSYSYFYNFLGKTNLTAPSHETSVMIGNHNTQASTYVALGDSLTAGVGVSDYQKSYPYLIAQKLSSKNNVQLINLAHPGDMSQDVLINQTPQAEYLKPDLITLLIGVNDIHNLKSLREFEANYSKIVSSLKKSGARIYLFSIPYLGASKIVYPPYNLILDLRTKQFNRVIKKISIDYGVNYIDLYALSKSVNFYSPDQFHPGAQGYKEWATQINVN